MGGIIDPCAEHGRLDRLRRRDLAAYRHSSRYADHVAFIHCGPSGLANRAANRDADRGRANAYLDGDTGRKCNGDAYSYTGPEAR
jgi:hypothetical protein